MAADPVAPAPALPTTVGSYKVVRQLGAGLMGATYLATHQGQYWALRVLDERAVRTTNAVNKLIGDILHPSLVRYREIGMDPQHGGFVSTDYMDAKPASRDMIAGLRSSARLKFIAELLAGLKVLHQRNAAHGAIKPSNVLLRGKGNELTGMFIDAGFAYVHNATTAPRLLAKAFPYLAPEVIEAYLAGDRTGIEKSLTISADIYSAGLLAAELFSGRPLFSAVRDAADLLARKRASTVEIVGLNNPLPHCDLAVLNQAIRQATSPDAASRPASVQVLIDALKAALPQAQAA